MTRVRVARGAILAAASAVGLGACVSTPPSAPVTPTPRVHGGAVAHPFDPAAALEVGRVVLAGHETFLMPIADPMNRPPAYPHARLAERLPRTEVCLRLAIGEDGRVDAVADVTGMPGCETARPVAADFVADFVAASLAAARDWRFEPAVRCVFASAAAKTAAANTGCATAREVPQAVSLHYRFVFELEDGRASVRWAN